MLSNEFLTTTSISTVSIGFGGARLRVEGSNVAIPRNTSRLPLHCRSEFTIGWDRVRNTVSKGRIVNIKKEKYGTRDALQKVKDILT